jgi:aryl-alcohol dehydrogenase-like predicted oxidoreductase
MDYRPLGKTGLNASVIGLGCGGHSRLGMARGKTATEAAEIVRRALELGVNFIDTAEAYGTEEAVGIGIKGVPREAVILSTKVGPRRKGEWETPEGLVERIDACLSRLGTDYVDILHLHGVSPDDYPRAAEELWPTLDRLRTAGKLRFIGITEAFGGDTTHRTLKQVIASDLWEVLMVGFNLLNPSARETVLPTTQEKGIGTLCMFAVRRALSQPDALRELVTNLIAKGEVDPEQMTNENNPLGWLVDEGYASSVTEAAYRFCRHEPGLDVILSGTGNSEHLEENARSLLLPPLPDAATTRLKAMFGSVDSVSGN